MKQTCIILLLISIVLVFTACRGTTQLPAGTIASTAATEDQTIAITEGEHPVEKSQLNFYMDGHEASANAVLFSFEGYSIYILEDKWDHGTDLINGYTVDLWQNTVEPDTTLMVLKMDASDLSTAHSWLKEAFAEYDLLEDSQGGMGGTNADGHMIDTQIISAESATYILIKKYALENAETAGTYLAVMADTFELT